MPLSEDVTSTLTHDYILTITDISQLILAPDWVMRGLKEAIVTLIDANHCHRAKVFCSEDPLAHDILHSEETLGETELAMNIMNCRVSSRCDPEMAWL